MTFSISTQSSTPSFDDSIRPIQNRLRNRQADLLGCFQVDHQLKLRWLLDWQVSRLCTFEDLVHIRSGTPVHVGRVSAIVHEAADFAKFRLWVNRWEPALYREFCDLCSLRKDDGARQHEDCVSPPLG